MKLFSSFKKELILATRSFYFYIEILFAVILLVVLLVAIPEHARVVQTEYIALDLPAQAADVLVASLTSSDLDGQSELATLEAGGRQHDARLFESEDAKVYLLENEESVRALAEAKMHLGAVISLDSQGALHYKYFLQGYEAPRLKNLIAVLHNISSQELEQRMDAQKVEILAATRIQLNDRENIIPTLIAFNSCFMGMFIMAAYVFLDKKEGVINAYAVTASSVSRYMLSKILVILTTGVVSGLIITLPVLGLHFNYALALLLILVSGFFASSLGLLIAGCFREITKAFGTIFLIIFILMVPVISYFLPGWNPLWVRFIPSDFVIQGFKAILLASDTGFVLLACAGLLAAGAVLFLLAERRLSRTLSI